MVSKSSLREEYKELFNNMTNKDVYDDCEHSGSTLRKLPFFSLCPTRWLVRGEVCRECCAIGIILSLSSLLQYLIKAVDIKPGLWLICFLMMLTLLTLNHLYLRFCNFYTCAPGHAYIRVQHFV